MPRSDVLASWDAQELQGLLTRCWMTHDAMWFKTAIETLGIEAANRLNRGAIRGMTPIEAQRILKALGMEGVANFSELRRFVEGASALLIGDYMDFEWSWLEDRQTLVAEMTRCFAFEGVSRLGVAASYECGIFDRVYGWLEALGIDYQVDPDVTLCTMYQTGRCVRILQVELPV